MKTTASKYEQLTPSGICRMGETDVTYFRTAGNRIWFDKKAIELVLTGKNQHNILGQDKDPKNHKKIFDTDGKKVIEVISKTGVHNYLKKAWSVRDENRHYFYEGLKSIELPREKKVTEPLQMPMFNANIPVKVNPFIKIVKDDKGTSVYCAMEGKTCEDRDNALVQMLLSVAHEIMVGKIQVKTARESA